MKQNPVGSATRTDLWVALLTGLACFAYFLSYMRYGYMEDEGYLVEGVSRVLEGQVIYRDFHHTYAPGRFYLFALLFLVFGKNLLVVRAGWAVLLAAKAGLAYWVGRKLTSRAFGLALALLVTLIPGPWHKTPFTFSAFLMLFAMVYLMDHEDTRSYLWVGLLTGLTALFRQDVAAFGAAGILVMLVLTIRAEGRRVLSRRVGAYFLGVGIPVIPVLVAFAAAGALGRMAQCVFLEGMRDNRANRLPFPSLLPVTEYGRSHAGAVVLLKSLFYLAPVLFVLSAARSVVRVVRRSADRTDAVLAGALVLSLGCFNQSLWRSDFPHLYQSLQPAYLLLVVLVFALARFLETKAIPPWIRRASTGAVCILILAFLCGPLLWGLNAMRDPRSYHALRAEGLFVRSVEYTGSALVRSGQTERLSLVRAPLVVDEGRAGFLEAVGAYLDENTRPGDYILSVPGFQMVYFLYDRKNPTRYIHVRRALGRAEEEAFIADVARAGTEVILYTEMAIDGDSERRLAVYARPIYDWIMENYQTDAVYGNLVFLKRRDPVDATP